MSLRCLKPPTSEQPDPLVPAGGGLDREELAPQDIPLEVLLHLFQPLADDSEDPARHLVVERLTQFVDRRDRVVEHEQGVESGAVQGRHRPAVDRVVGGRVVKLAAEDRHRLPHDRVAQPQQDLMLLEPKDSPAADLLLDQGRVEHQLHLVGLRTDREGLSGQPFPPGRGPEPIEPRPPRDLVQRPLALDGDCGPEDLHERLGRDSQPGVGAFEQFPRTPVQVCEVVWPAVWPSSTFSGLRRISSSTNRLISWIEVGFPWK